MCLNEKVRDDFCVTGGILSEGHFGLKIYMIFDSYKINFPYLTCLMNCLMNAKFWAFQ